MTLLAPSAPAGPQRVRIAITSPDILAQIRQVFASRNLDVEIVRTPYVEITVKPAASTGSAVAAVEVAGLSRLVSPPSPAGVPGARRLCAEYRLVVVEAGETPKAEHRPAESRWTLPSPARSPEADGPVATLSQRQHEVMALVSRGVRNAEIAERLQVSEKTVKNHINRIFRSLGAGSRVEAVLIWQRHQRQQRSAATRRGGPVAAAVSSVSAASASAVAVAVGPAAVSVSAAGPAAT